MYLLLSCLEMIKPYYLFLGVVLVVAIGTAHLILHIGQKRNI